MTSTCIISTWACTCNMFKSTMVVFAIQATTDLSIQPPQLEFLLEDFTRKLSHSLIAATSKRKSFLKVGTHCGGDGGGGIAVVWNLVIAIRIERGCYLL